MRKKLLGVIRRTGPIAALGLLLAGLLMPAGAAAGVATAGAVLLDPFDPVPEIQFRHFGGYGCAERCGGYDRCHSGCYRHRHCDDGCDRRDRCDHDCGGSNADSARYVAPCQSGRCSDSEHYERHWRDGDHVGQDYFDRGHRERDLSNGAAAPRWFGHSPDWHDDDDDDRSDGGTPPHDAH